MDIDVRAESFRLREAFTISRGSRSEARVLTVTLRHDGVSGRGECVPYARYGETVDLVTEQIAALGPIFADMSRADLDVLDLARLLPPGAARNAVDCAVWDWRAKRAGQRIWDLVPAWPRLRPVETAVTLSLGTAEAMQAAARRASNFPLLKIKLGGEGDMARLEAVRAGAPKARVIVDANEGWTAEEYAALAPHLVRLGVDFVEQPLPAGEDGILAEIARPLPVCADESCHDRASLSGLAGKYDIVNIKLDKTGGLTEAMALQDEARAVGFGVMVGCMVGTSLAMAPALVVAQGADVVDLDGPLLLAEDRETPLRIEGASIHPPEPALWG